MRVVAAVVAALLAAPAAARDVGGVQFTDTISVGGTELVLNGAGVRKKMVFKVYAGGLYLARPSGDAAAVLAADAPWRVRMVFLREVDKKTILDTYREGFEANSAGPGLPALVAKLERIAPALANMRKGGEMFVTYAPGQGTTVAAAGGGAVTVEGKEFADAMLRNWLGPSPADPGLKQAFLGKR